MSKAEPSNQVHEAVSSKAVLKLFEYFAEARREQGISVKAAEAADTLAAISDRSIVKIAASAVAAWERG